MLTTTRLTTKTISRRHSGIIYFVAFVRKTVVIYVICLLIFLPWLRVSDTLLGLEIDMQIAKQTPAPLGAGVCFSIEARYGNSFTNRRFPILRTSGSGTDSGIAPYFSPVSTFRTPPSSRSLRSSVFEATTP
jgi:hypothetical protein